jgi:hypothetical protein
MSMNGRRRRGHVSFKRQRSIPGFNVNTPHASIAFCGIIQSINGAQRTVTPSAMRNNSGIGLMGIFLGHGQRAAFTPQPVPIKRGSIAQ